jgi:hypothetical protein
MTNLTISGEVGNYWLGDYQLAHCFHTQILNINKIKSVEENENRGKAKKGSEMRWGTKLAWRHTLIIWEFRFLH